MSNDEDGVCFLWPTKNVGTSIIMRMSETNRKERTRKPNFAREVLVEHSKSLKQREQVALGVRTRHPGRPVRPGCTEKRGLAAPTQVSSSRQSLRLGFVSKSNGKQLKVSTQGSDMIRLKFLSRCLKSYPLKPCQSSVVLFSPFPSLRIPGHGWDKTVAVKTRGRKRDAFPGKQGIFLTQRSLLGGGQLHLEMAQVTYQNNMLSNSLAQLSLCEGKNSKCFSVVISTYPFTYPNGVGIPESLEVNVAKTLPMPQALLHEVLLPVICLFLAPLWLLTSLLGSNSQTLFNTINTDTVGSSPAPQPSRSM